MLDVVHKFGIDIEGACGGQCSCATCHVIFPVDLFGKFVQPGDEENDMLDLASEVEATSRLGCQVKVTEDFDGVQIRLPKSTFS